MADTGLIFPGAAVNDATVGTIDWIENWDADPDNANDLIGAISADGGGGLHPTGVRISASVTDSTAKLFIGGVPAGSNKAFGTGFTTGIRTYGSASDLWGLTPTTAQVNASDFGFGISLTGNGGTSKYLYVSNFGFTIPASTIIDGIEVKCDVQIPSGNPNFDYIQVKIYYTSVTNISNDSTDPDSGGWVQGVKIYP